MIRDIFGLRTILLVAGALTGASALRAEPLAVEKPDLKFGFIKLTDCAPLVLAKELGYFDDEFLSVTLEPQANWKILLDRVIGGELDGAHMLAGQPIGAMVGIGTQARIITALSLDLNGNAITVSNALWKEMQAADPALAAGRPPHPIRATALKPSVDRAKAAGAPMRLGMVFPVSTHNYYLRYWLAAAGINPGSYAGDTTGTTDADVLLSVTPPPQMPATLEAGTIQGYCVGEPWNQQAVVKGVGVPVITDYEIWPNNPEKVFGVTEEWARKYPNTHLAVLKALLRAAIWLDASPEHRRQAVDILSRPHYVGADRAVLMSSMTGTFEYAKGDVRSLPDFNVFFRHHATYPYYSDCIWFLTQMRRWKQIPAHPDDWYAATAREVYRPDLYRQAASLLIAEGKMSASDLPDTDGYKPADPGFIDGIAYDGHRPNAYLKSLAIGAKD